MIFISIGYDRFNISIKNEKLAEVTKFIVGTTRIQGSIIKNL